MKKLLLLAIVSLATTQTYPMLEQIRQAIKNYVSQNSTTTNQDSALSQLGQILADQLAKNAPEGSALSKIGQQILEQFKNLTPAKVEQFKELHGEIKATLSQVDQILSGSDEAIAPNQISGLLNAIHAYGHGLFGLPRLTGLAQDIYANTNVKELYKTLVAASPTILPTPSTSGLAPRVTIKDQFANSFIRALALKILSHNLSIADKAGFEKLKPVLTPEIINPLD